MINKSIKWFKVAESKSGIDWPDNGLIVLEVAGRKITLAKKGKAVWACAYKCPHAGGVLAEGFVDGAGNIVCPIHGYRFGLRSGHNVSGEGYHLKTFVLEERATGLFIGFEENEI